MPDNRGVNNARDRPGCAGRFMQRLGEIAPLNEIGKPFQKFADVNGCAMKVKKPLCKDRDRNNAASQNRPHQQPALLDVLDHLIFVSLFRQGGKRPAGGVFAISSSAVWPRARETQPQV